MFRRRLRPPPSDEELAEIYTQPHDHYAYGHGHYLRVEHTIVLGKWMIQDFDIKTGADLSCGNGAILQALPLELKVFGDFASGTWYAGEMPSGLPVYKIQKFGPIEETIDQIDPVDLFICSETIEHLDDPDSVLKKIREKSNYLLLSTPIGENNLDNREHLWGWDEEAVLSMMENAGWDSIAHLTLETPGHGYTYQIWSMR